MHRRIPQSYEADMIDKHLLGIGKSPQMPYFMLGGFADEAADSIEVRSRQQRPRLKYIKRSVNGKNIHDISNRNLCMSGY